MVYYYSIQIQFVNPCAPEFTSMKSIISEAIDYYNKKSLIVTNPKKIVKSSYLDSSTLELILSSTVDLPYPTKALQTFSRYLCTPEKLGKYIYGNSLFKMKATKQAAPETDLKELQIKAIKLILNNSITEVELKEIIEYLGEKNHEIS